MTKLFRTIARSTIAVLAAVALLSSAAGAQLDVRQVFERARLLEENNQKLAEAIRLYAQVVSKAKEQRAMAAQAQLRIGLLYERLGRKAEALRAFRAVAANFADQAAAVAQANARLVALGATVATEKNVVVRHIGDYMGAVVARDGRSFLYTERAGQNEMPRAFFYDLETGESRPFRYKYSLKVNGGSAVFSRDDKRIAYALAELGTRREIRVASVDGSNDRQIFFGDGFRDTRPEDWSPDGRYLVANFLPEATFLSQIVLFDLTTGDRRALYQANGVIFGIKFSPEGKSVAFGLNEEIYLLDVDSGKGEPRPLPFAGQKGLIDWLPDGRIAYVSDVSGTRDIYTLRVNDGRAEATAEVIKKDISRANPLAITANGSLFYQLNASSQDVFFATVTSLASSPPPVAVPVSTRFAGANCCPAYSPDGQYLAFLSGPDDAPGRSIRIQTLANGKETQLSGAYRWINTMRWFPDGRALLAQGAGLDGRVGLYRVGVPAGDTSPVLIEGGPGGDMAANPAFSSDGKSVFFKHYRNASGSIFKLHLDTGKVEEVVKSTPEHMIRYFALSPGGDRAALGVRSKRGESIAIVPITGGEFRIIYDHPEGEITMAVAGIAWTADERSVLFTRRKDGSPGECQVWRVPAEGGPAEKLFVTPQAGTIRNIAVQPGGKQIAVQLFTANNQLWVMENLLPRPSPSAGTRPSAMRVRSAP